MLRGQGAPAVGAGYHGCGFHDDETWLQVLSGGPREGRDEGPAGGGRDKNAMANARTLVYDLKTVRTAKDTTKTEPNTRSAGNSQITSLIRLSCAVMHAVHSIQMLVFQLY